MWVAYLVPEHLHLVSVGVSALEQHAGLVEQRVEAEHVAQAFQHRVQRCQPRQTHRHRHTGRQNTVQPTSVRD